MNYDGFFLLSGGSPMQQCDESSSGFCDNNEQLCRLAKECGAADWDTMLAYAVGDGLFAPPAAAAAAAADDPFSMATLPPPATADDLCFLAQQPPPPPAGPFFLAPPPPPPPPPPPLATADDPCFLAPPAPVLARDDGGDQQLLLCRSDDTTAAGAAAGLLDEQGYLDLGGRSPPPQAQVAMTLATTPFIYTPREEAALLDKDGFLPKEGRRAILASLSTALRHALFDDEMIRFAAVQRICGEELDMISKSAWTEFTSHKFPYGVTEREIIRKFIYTMYRPGIDVPPVPEARHIPPIHTIYASGRTFGTWAVELKAERIADGEDVAEMYESQLDVDAIMERHYKQKPPPPNAKKRESWKRARRIDLNSIVVPSSSSSSLPTASTTTTSDKKKGKGKRARKEELEKEIGEMEKELAVKKQRLKTMK